MSVDKRSRKAMVAYLTGHFRYDTMSSWNASTSYAVKVKLHTFVPNDLMDRAFDLIGVEGVYDPINDILNNWAREQDFAFQAGFNGRSSGYIVMYQGGKKPSEYKRICHACGQRNYAERAVTCGRCGSDDMHDYKGIETFSYPGKSIDMGETFDESEWSMDALRERVKLVESFDAMVERCKEEFISMCRSFKVEEETIMVPTKVKVLVEA